jgi:uncharacterized membrane protein (DUF106 family)
VSVIISGALCGLMSNILQKIQQDDFKIKKYKDKAIKHYSKYKPT